MDEAPMNSENEKAAKSLRLGTVFSPAAPVNQTELFAGRQQELREIADAANQRGTHAILFGERGVGKTSLVNVLPKFLTLAGVEGLIPVIVNCDSTDTFESLSRKMLREIQVSIQLPSTGFVPQMQVVTQNLVDSLPPKPSPEDIRYTLQRIGGKLLLIIDEFDRLEDESIPRLIADTIKTLSDHSIDATLVLVGVADTVDQLLKEHLSIDRCLVQVHMPRMSLEEIADILNKALIQVEMQIDDEASEFITYLSHGLPHYTHLLGITSARAAIESDRLEIHPDDVVTALQSAVHQAQQSILVSYSSATSSHRKESLFEHVLLACALAPVDELGYFSSTDVKKPMALIMGREYEIAAFARHLDAFCGDDREHVLDKSGTPRRYRYRFSNPLIQPYVVMRGLYQGLITTEMLEDLYGNGAEE